MVQPFSVQVGADICSEVAVALFATLCFASLLQTRVAVQMVLSPFQL